MPEIKAFKGIRPCPKYVERVVLQVENLTIKDAKGIREENPLSFVNMLVPKLENRYLRASKEAQAYKKIGENFEDFLDEGVLIRDEKPCIYVYRVTHFGITQTGVWTVTSIDDYLNNTVKKHELTRIDREKSLMNYLDEAGIDANPVLVTYPTNKTVKKIIDKVCAAVPDTEFEQGGLHKLWKIDDEKTVAKLVEEFAALPASYIADGHHRAAAAALLGMHRRRFNLKHTGKEEYNFFTSVYIPADELKIIEFNRLCKIAPSFDLTAFLKKISKNFDTKKSIDLVNPRQRNVFGMYVKGQWYRLKFNSKPKSQNPSAQLDVSILQDFVLSPLLHISDPRHNKNLDFVGGLTPINEVIKLVDGGEFDIAFTLFPTSINELISVADAGEVMPPKSTWFEPKFHVGLVIHQY